MIGNTPSNERKKEAQRYDVIFSSITWWKWYFIRWEYLQKRYFPVKQKGKTVSTYSSAFLFLFYLLRIEKS